MTSVRAIYRIESFLPLVQAAEVLAGEQSSGTFVAVPGETDELRRRHRAQVVAIEELPSTDAPSLPGALRSNGSDNVNVGIVTVDFPLENFGPSLPNLLAAVAGNLFELRELAGIRLLDLLLPDAFRQEYPGPGFGVAGTRALMDRPDGPMIGSIIKPSVGLAPSELAHVVRDLVDAGVDFIKDDELIANPPYSPLRDRVAEVMRVINEGAERTGKKVMYAFNITDEFARLPEHHQTVLEAGGTCVMVCVNLVGLSGVRALRDYTAVPIHGHRTMIGALMRHPGLGIDFCAYQKLARLAGVDHLHTNGMNNKFYETNEEVQASVAAVREPLLGGYEIVPVLSSAQSAVTVPISYELIQTTDVLMVAGGGIHAHPGGVRAGVESIRQAWDAVVAGVGVTTLAQHHSELRQALDYFGGTRAPTSG